MDTITGNFQTTDEDFYPFAFGTADSVDFDLVKQIYCYPAANIPPGQNTQTRSVTVNDHLYAVIIVTQDAILNPHQEYHNFFWDDASAMFCTLVNVYGYSKDHIYVHYYNGTSPKSGGDLDKDEPNHDYDIDYPASKSRILETFDNLAGTSNSDPNIPALTPSDQLFVFIEGHGLKLNNHSSLVCAYPGPYYNYLYDNELAQHVENINCAQMLFLVQPCFSGNFATELTDYSNYTVSCKNRTVHTATSADLYSTTESYMTNNQYMEYSFYWTAAARKGYPIFNQPWKTYDYEPGEFPFDQYYPFNDHPDDHDPDLNGDGFVQMEEAFAYADYMDAWSVTGYYHPDNQCWECYEEPQNKDKIGYDNGTKYNNLITLFGISGSVLDDDYLLTNRNYMAGNTITVPEDMTFTIDNNASIYLTGEDGKIEVSEDGQLDLNEDVNVNNNSISVHGYIEVEPNVTFNNVTISLNNDNSTTFEQTTFDGSELTSYCPNLDISNSSFTSQGYLMTNLYNGNININNTSFNNTWLYMENKSNIHGLLATVNNCTFQTVYTMAAIDLWGYDKFYIENNTMHGYYNGIQLNNSGEGQSGNQNIFNNEIYGCTMTGILVYNSTASISSNYIHNNKYGIRLNDNCNIALYGNPGATTYDDVNYITDNDSYEVYISTGSFPWSFHYNAIIDEDNQGNPDDPMVYYEPSSNGNALKDVKYNCWGNNFNAADDLYPSGYMVEPRWCPGNGGGGNKSTEIAKQVFETGLTHFDSLEYTQAKTYFDSVVNNYPHTQFAESAMKELFALEQFLNNDYSTLKSFYQTNDSIQADTTLSKLGAFLANKCEVRIENWQNAIDHYEDIIDNPETPADSIFAVIDLGYTYLLMENDTSNRSVAMGKYTEFVPKSEKEYREKVNYLLSLLPVKKNQSQQQIVNSSAEDGILSQNYPNPFGTTTRITYNLSAESNVQLKVYNYAGQLIRIYNERTKPKGIHYIDFDASTLQNGIYLYEIYINGQQESMKKMVIMK